MTRTDIFRKTAVGLLVAAFVAPEIAMPSQPPAVPADRVVFSLNGMHYAFLDADEEVTTVHRIRPDKRGKSEKVWSMPGWFAVAALSNDGERLVAGHPGNNILAPGYSPQTPILRIFHQGEPEREITLDDLVDDVSGLPESSAGYSWGTYVGFNSQGQYVVETYDGKLIGIDIETGALIPDPDTF